MDNDEHGRVPPADQILDALAALEGGGIAAYARLFDLCDDLVGCTDQVMRLLGRATPERTGFEVLDEVMRRVNVPTLSVRGMLGLLTVTGSTRDRYTERAAFAQRCRAELQRTEPERVDALLMGLE